MAGTKPQTQDKLPTPKGSQKGSTKANPNPPPKHTKQTQPQPTLRASTRLSRSKTPSEFRSVDEAFSDDDTQQTRERSEETKQSKSRRPPKPKSKPVATPKQEGQRSFETFLDDFIAGKTEEEKRMYVKIIQDKLKTQARQPQPEAEAQPEPEAELEVERLIKSQLQPESQTQPQSQPPLSLPLPVLPAPVTVVNPRLVVPTISLRQIPQLCDLPDKPRRGKRFIVINDSPNRTQEQFRDMFLNEFKINGVELLMEHPDGKLAICVSTKQAHCFFKDIKNKAIKIKGFPASLANKKNRSELIEELEKLHFECLHKSGKFMIQEMDDEEKRSEGEGEGELNEDEYGVLSSSERGRERERERERDRSKSVNSFTERVKEKEKQKERSRKSRRFKDDDEEAEFDLREPRVFSREANEEKSFDDIIMDALLSFESVMTLVMKFTLENEKSLLKFLVKHSETYEKVCKNLKEAYGEIYDDEVNKKAEERRERSRKRLKPDSELEPEESPALVKKRDVVEKTAGIALHESVMFKPSGVSRAEKSGTPGKDEEKKEGVAEEEDGGDDDDEEGNVEETGGEGNKKDNVG